MDRPKGLSVLETGVLPLRLLLLPGVPLLGVADRWYRGGVTYRVPAAAGGVALGSRPSRERCDGVRGMSASSSCRMKRGEAAV